MDSVDNPSWCTPAYKRMMRGWQMMQHLFGGTQVMRDAILQAHRVGSVPTPTPVQVYQTAGGTAFEGPGTYLPRHEKELEADYLVRLLNTELFNAVKQTIRGLSGMVFRRDPKLGDDVPVTLRTHWEDLDYTGTHGDIFARQMIERALLYGHHGVLVESPALPATGARTMADEQRMGTRPYWVHVAAHQIINWLPVTLANGEHTFKLLVLQFEVTRATGRYTTTTVLQWLELRLDPATEVVSYIRWEKTTSAGGQDEWVPVATGVLQNQTRIPFVLCAASDVSNLCETQPPLLDLGYLNLAHFRVQSDRRHSLHLSSVPFLVFVGRDSDAAPISVGPNTGLDIPLGADAKYVEHNGSALGATAEELKMLEGRMAQTGLAMLQRESGAAETAEAKRLDKGEQDSVLGLVARSVEDALETAMQFHANYLSEPDGGSITINRDFEDATMSVEEMNAYSAQVAAGQLSLATMWEMMVQGQRLPADFNPDEEQQAIDEATLPDDEPTLLPAATDPLTGLPLLPPEKPVLELTT